MATKFNPTGDRILVKRTKPEQESAGGIIIPEDRQVKSRFGEVLAVGPGRFLKGSTERRPIEVQPGQVVFFRGISGQEVTIDGEEGYVILREDEVEAVVDNP